MDYSKAYLTAAEKIQSGQYQQERKSQHNMAVEEQQGLLRRRVQETTENQPNLSYGGDSEEEPYENFLAFYMGQIRQSSQSDQEVVKSHNEVQIPQYEVTADLESARNSIIKIESGGDHTVLGPVIQKGRYKGQRAVGLGQVMEGNVGPWTKEVFGKAMTVEDFRNNKEAQLAVIDYKLQQAYDKYGSWEDAASVWFSGRPVAKAGNASDGYNTVPQYIEKFRGNLTENQPLVAKRNG